jgi:hypothetical protein
MPDRTSSVVEVAPKVFAILIPSCNSIFRFVRPADGSKS